MRITSILIDGREWVSKTFIKQAEIQRDSGDRMGTARFFILTIPDLEAAVDTAMIGEAIIDSGIRTGQTIKVYGSESGSSLFGGSIFGEPLFGEDETEAGELIFAGEITLAKRQLLVAKRLKTGGTGAVLFGDAEFGGPLFDMAPGYESVNVVQVECRDYSDILESTIVEVADYEDESDQNIIDFLFTAYAPSIDITNVALTAILKSFSIQQESLRSILQKICERTGAIFTLDYEKRLHYFLPTTRPAPFGLSESPDNETSFSFYREGFDCQEEWRMPCNSCTVVGTVTTNGANITATVEDVHSIAAYGKKQRRIVDRNIASVEEARARADVEVARDRYPKTIGSLITRKDGLEVGHYLPIYCFRTLHLNDSFVVRRITLRWISRIHTEYTVEWGDYLPDLNRAISNLQEAAAKPAAPPVSIPAPGTVTAVSLASTIEAVRLVSSLPPLPDAAYGPNSFVALTSVTPPRLYRRNGTNWDPISNLADLNGQIVTTQITDGAISTPKIAALSIDATKIQASAITAGKIAADAVIAGTIAAGAIRAIDAAFDTGAIQSADIANAAITNAKIGDAEISTAKIGNLQVQTINIAGSAVTNNEIQPGAVTGGSGGSLANGTIQGLNIANATIGNAHIVDLAASKILAGTINVGAGGITIMGSLVPFVVSDLTSSSLFLLTATSSAINAAFENPTQSIIRAQSSAAASAQMETNGSSEQARLLLTGDTSGHTMELLVDAGGPKILFDGVQVLP